MSNITKSLLKERIDIAIEIIRVVTGKERVPEALKVNYIRSAMKIWVNSSRRSLKTSRLMKSPMNREYQLIPPQIPLVDRIVSAGGVI